MKDTFKKYMKGSPKVAPASPPREMADIMNDYTQLCGRLGQSQYRLRVLEADIANLVSQLSRLDNEAGERKKLDAQKPKEEENVSQA